MEDQKKNSLLDDDLSLEELAKNFDNIDINDLEKIQDLAKLQQQMNDFLIDRQMEFLHETGRIRNAQCKYFTGIIIFHHQHSGRIHLHHDLVMDPKHSTFIKCRISHI